ncbi:hypothetical protein Pan44_36700 [Caulifigura coniformis]|uniref:BioF2-like acetyltransferase domain-containing protein n=1 Tax=Caulifigura coniformis TaxID=2527983 RepID=A0A517SHM1_9PLAN|nr:GNAT family N-acetyltransferase [Caulifigura coniformis]QDT55624.1 hypothetical protein Pan44_36700 [Caulifigura coniformis]
MNEPGPILCGDSIASIRDELAQGCAAGTSTSVAVRPLSLLRESDFRDWRDLARRAVEPNPFQEPQFITALQEAGVVSSLNVLSVVDDSSGQWLAAGVFEVCLPSLTRPLPHLRSLSSRYSFLDSPLVHRDHLPRALESALRYLQRQRWWHGARFRVVKSEGPQAAEWSRQTKNAGLAIDRDRTWRRAVTHLAGADADALLSRCSRSRRKSLLRARRSLEASGPVSHRLVVPGPHDSRAREEFLRLEALGWKGGTGTAIASSQSDSQFFRNMTEQFAADRRVIFGELLVGDRVIASTCNLVAGTTVFAFKLGWDPEFARGNPGHWAEIELAAALARERPDLERIDSCSQPGSYVEAVSTSSQAMESSVCVWSRRATALCELRRQFRVIRSGWWAAARSEAPADSPDANAPIAATRPSQP